MNFHNPHDIVKFEIHKLLENIKNTYPRWDLNYDQYTENIFKIKNKNKRCMGRMWDIGKINGILKIGDINKQCRNKAKFNELCKSCLCKDFHGRVDEMPYMKTLYVYKKYIKKHEILGNKNFLNRNINLEINLNKYKKNIEEKSPKKKSNKKHKGMTFIKQSNIKIKITDNKANPNKLTNNNSEIYKKMSINSDIYESWWNSELTDKIKIYDNINNSYFTFAIEESSMGDYLLNKNQVILGEFRDWVDIENNIPECFKNEENKVIDPHTVLPLREYEIYSDNVIYHDLNPTIYRKYRYDDNAEELIFTNLIE